MSRPPPAAAVRGARGGRQGGSIAPLHALAECTRVAVQAPMTSPGGAGQAAVPCQEGAGGMRNGGGKVQPPARPAAGTGAGGPPAPLPGTTQLRLPDIEPG